jgi:DNA-binding winged helix-turn-helix (wHTH) protein/TolB-like protein/lipoprotein NlpI
MALESKVLYEFDSFRLNPADHSLVCGEKPVSLTPKSFDILVTLIERNGQLVTKDELMKKIWPDSFVEEANLTVNVSALRKALGDTTEHQQYIETVPKLGYRFTARVTARNGSLASVVEIPKPSETQQQDNPSDAKLPASVLPISEPTEGQGHRWLLLAAFVAVVLLVMIGFAIFRKAPLAIHVIPEPRRLAILPFQNIRKDPDSDFLGYSLADAVITKLGYVQTLRIRPSYAIEKYRDQIVEIPKVGADLDVDTLLTGNFIRDGDDLRITCQLIDVKSRNMLWKGAFDLRYQKLFTVQDQVAEQIIQGLELNLSSTEAARLKLDEPASPLAYEYYLRGVDLYSRSDFPLAIQMLEKSAQIDPKYALTWAYLGRSYTASGSFQFEGRDSYHKAQAAFDKALAVQPALIETRIYLANFLTDTGRVEKAVPLLRESLKTNSHHAELHWELGYAYRYAGMLNESVEECEQARQIDPGVKINSSALNTYLYLREYDKFIQSLPRNSQLPFHIFYRGFAEYHQNRLDQAVQDFDRAFELDPELLQAQIGKALSFSVGHQEAKGLEILRTVESKIQTRGVGDSEAIYKLAQAYAVLGDRASALRMLKHSIDNGFFPYPYFVSDPLLAGVRSEPHFQEVLQSASQRYEAFKKTFF